MSFRVVWRLPARDDLARIWKSASSMVREELTSEIHQLEIELQRDPKDVGESRDGDDRIAFICQSAIAVGFRVDQDRALILQIRKLR